MGQVSTGYTVLAIGKANEWTGGGVPIDSFAYSSWQGRM